MLSYRHAYHAGNHADVLKHLILVYCLDYLTRKEAPLRYIDTHGGAGLYRLDSDYALKTGEAAEGIARLQNADVKSELVQRYLALVASAGDRRLSYYPGSPWLAARCLREQDRLVVTELHNTDLNLLQQTFKRDRRIKVAAQDGFERLLSELPAPERRALVLIDPSYEIKADYDRVKKAVADALRKMPNAVMAIWMPVVDRNRSRRLEKSLSSLGPSFAAELGVRPDEVGHGMTASTMLVLNPPWGLDRALESLKEPLLTVLGLTDVGHFRLHSSPL